MSKILLKINKDEELTYPADGYVLGIEGFSQIFDKTYNVEEIREIKNKIDKEIYVSFNRIIFNDELEEYKKLLQEIDKLKINGIIVGDIAPLTYNLDTNIILDQMHLNNSYYSINHYYNNGVSGIVLTNDITLDEINEINNNTKCTLFKQVFGYPHLSTSRRRLVSNYLEGFKIDNKASIYEIKEDKSNDYYKIIEDDFGTHILGDKPLNLLGYNLNVDYLIIDGFKMDNIKEVLDVFISGNIEKKEYLDNKYNATAGFINTKTIYRVKKDER